MTKRRSNNKSGSSSSSTISPLNSSIVTTNNEHQEMNNDGDDNSSVGNNNRANNMNKRSSYTKKQIVMSDSKLSEEAALTAQLFGGDVGGGAPSSAAWMDEDDNEEDDHNAMVSNNVSGGGGESDLLFAIDRSGEEVTTDDNNNVQSDDENESEEVRHPPLDYDVNRSNDHDYDSDDHDDVKDVNNKASMTGAAWQDSDTDNNSSSDSEVDNDDDGSSDEDKQQQHLPPNKKQKKGVSLVDGPDRLKKLRRYRDETNPLSLKEYELRLRERFMSTSSVAARTDWASVGLAQKQQQLGDDEEDDEDGGIQRKKKKKKMRGYASSSSEEDGSDDDEDYKDKATQLLQSNASLFETSNKSNGIALPPTLLNVVRARDGNLSDPNNSVVNATQFHPQSDEDSPLLMTAGMDKMLRFFRINDDTNNGENTKIHGIHFPKMPITCASFLTGGGGSSSSNVVLSGRRPFFYVYDAISGSIQKIPSIIGRSERSLEKFVVSPPSSCHRSMIAFIGNDGYIILVDGVTYQWIGDLKMNGSVRAVTFSEDGDYIMGSGSDGDVYKWHIGSRRCVERFHNEDGTITSSLAISSNFLAVGAESGVVNLYNDRQSYSSMTSRSSIALTATMTERTPLKSIMNLTTSADNVCFNHDGQILAMSTRRETNGLKLLHVPTATVFSNWPTSKTPLKYVWSMDFSPGSKYFTVGNDHGKCLLYRLKHYWDE